MVVLPEPCSPTSMMTVGGTVASAMRRLLLAEHRDELVVDDLDELLPGPDVGLRRADADGLLLDPLEELAGELEADVGLEEDPADFAKPFLDRVFGKNAPPRERPERGGEFPGQLVEHKPRRITGLRRLDQPGLNGAVCHPERSEGAMSGMVPFTSFRVTYLRTALPPYRLTALPFTPMTTPQPRAVPIPQVADAEAKQLQLDRMKRRATGLLVVMSAVFLVTLILEPQHPWLGYVRATAEAAMVGGLADWFAITALFRHPLNIPIPHTAIIPNRKDRIGRTPRQLRPAQLSLPARSSGPGSSRSSRAAAQPSGSGGRSTHARSRLTRRPRFGAPPTWYATRTCTASSSAA